MIKTSLVFATFTTMSIFSTVHDFHNKMPSAVEIVKEDPRLTEVKKALVYLKRDPKNAKPIYYTALAKNIPHLLWVANIERESEYKITAISPKGYKGLGQTPRAIMRLGYEEADLMAAACVLSEKLRISHGDMKLALRLYKGGNNAAAEKEARKVFALYSKLKEHVNGKS